MSVAFRSGKCHGRRLKNTSYLCVLDSAIALTGPGRSHVSVAVFAFFSSTNFCTFVAPFGTNQASLTSSYSDINSSHRSPSERYVGIAYVELCAT